MGKTILGMTSMTWASPKLFKRYTQEMEELGAQMKSISDAQRLGIDSFFLRLNEGLNEVRVLYKPFLVLNECYCNFRLYGGFCIRIMNSFLIKQNPTVVLSPLLA